VALSWNGVGFTATISSDADVGDVKDSTDHTCKPCKAYVPPACNNNGVCDPGETTATCPQDCPPPPLCNENGLCEPALGETALNCPSDCAPQTCNGNGVCEPVLGENATNCPNDCAPQGCNWNGVCEPWRGETSFNCSFDCQPACTPCLGRICGIDTSCGQAVSCGTCGPNEQCNSFGNCESGSICLPCGNEVPPGACGTFWSPSCQRYAYCGCENQPGTSCQSGQCVGSGGGGDLPDRPDCNCSGVTWGCSASELDRLIEAFCIEAGGQN
jgi:hypothetical protein